VWSDESFRKQMTGERLMTEQHPLTDEIIEEIAQFEPDLTDPLRLNRTNDMRAATDWQLEQVIDWVSKFGWYLFEHPCQKHEFISELKKIMRPQQQEKN
jgi:hypothetical protein